MTFYRAETQAGDDPWTVRELVPPGLAAHGHRVRRRRGTSRISMRGAVSIELVAGDTVTCTFTDRLIPPTGDLLITKLTRGGVGTFPFGVRPVGGGDLSGRPRPRRRPGCRWRPRRARSTSIPATTGSVSASHARPARATGCGRPPAATRGAGTPGNPCACTITAGAGAVCQFENRFIPAGSIRILKTTRGAGATTGFVVSPLRDPELQFVQSAPHAGRRRHGDRARRPRRAGCGSAAT